PMAFVLGLGGLAAASGVWAPAGWLLAGVLSLYAAGALAASCHAAARARDWALAVVLPGLFLSLHLAYGLGSLLGAGQVMARLARGDRRRR
ncbi:MAG: hypothetical protein AAB368_06210, partial [bacterium]